MSHAKEPARRWRNDTDEPYDGRRLELSPELREALQALTSFAEKSPPSDAWRHESAHGNLTIDSVRPHTGLVALNAAAATVASGLPPCPYAPAGSALTLQFLAPNNKLVLRCAHTNPAHCWEDLGDTPYQC